jgi:hypothetical protein
VRERQIPRAIKLEDEESLVKEVKRRKLSTDLHGSIMKW